MTATPNVMPPLGLRIPTQSVVPLAPKSLQLLQSQSDCFDPTPSTTLVKPPFWIELHQSRTQYCSLPPARPPTDYLFLI